MMQNSANTTILANLTNNEMRFLEMANNPASRPNLLARLEQLGLLAAFLAAESGTTQ